MVLVITAFTHFGVLPASPRLGEPSGQTFSGRHVEGWPSSGTRTELGADLDEARQQVIRILEEYRRERGPQSG